ncbi:MAG: nuclease, partial [Candidatus Krumholzibacteriota bacterium]|nr:nuclease [Candidatus Krumholzibacteriota bacterium]
SAAPGERTEASRYIPAAVRDAVFARDKGRCTYTGPDGKRCGSTHNLQIDHIVPFACGGTALIHNLRLLCGKHNRLSAERIFGPRAPGRRL